MNLNIYLKLKTKAWFLALMLLSPIASYSAESESQLKFVLMGDSITEFWPSRHAEFFKDKQNWIDHGIAGTTTSNMVNRFYKDVVLEHPAVVQIMGGTNDIAENDNHDYSLESTTGNIKKMVEMAQENGIKVILGTVPPASEFYWNLSIKDTMKKIRELNAWLKEFATAKNLELVDYYAVLNYLDKGLKVEFQIGGSEHDYVHPNAYGYRAMEKVLLPVAKKLEIYK